MYRAGIHALMFCGCVGKNGGGLAHYVGQEKLAPAESWGAIAFAKDWYSGLAPAERAELALREHRPVALREVVHRLPHRPAEPTEGSIWPGHTMDAQVRAVRNGWLPFYPQFKENSLDLVREAEEEGRANERRRRSSRVVGQGQAEGKAISVLGGGSRRPEELAAGLVHLARQRADVQQQGTRVLPAALPGHPHNAIATDIAGTR